MQYGISILLSGISLGGQYALIAIGYTMVYGILRLINFAHGDVFMVAGLMMVYLSASLPLAAAIPLMIILTVLLGFIIERAAYKPLRTAPRMSVMISAIGVRNVVENHVDFTQSRNLIIAGVIKYIPFASRSALNSMLQLSGEIEEAAIIQDIPWYKRMLRIIIPIQKSSIINGYMLPFMTCLRELSLFLLLCTQGFILSTTLDYFDEMGLYAFSSAINLILIVTILIFNTLVNKLTGSSLDEGIGGK